MSVTNLDRHNRQIKDVRIEHFASDCIAMSGWTFGQIQNKIFLKLYLIKQVHKIFLKFKVYVSLV